ncbi:hypothetical protein PRIPAC_86053 [Pristionchus pacificus]|uniref:Uncharacterized protein n=1 Tax=Pristionchus pacificus TaxID=54126 RepID=A0A2A6BUK9_PRIPA|nr:hypothetical protein PRIPAC_86053 [Pristionchus pacificus]|eukprot:PDM69604.1 hypothetical protein PRIPAC_44700 [Pristionchus pacificus]
MRIKRVERWQNRKIISSRKNIREVLAIPPVKTERSGLPYHRSKIKDQNFGTKVQKSGIPTLGVMLVMFEP